MVRDGLPPETRRGPRGSLTLFVASLGASVLAVFAASSASADCFGGRDHLALRDKPPRNKGGFIVSCECTNFDDVATVRATPQLPTVALVDPPSDTAQGGSGGKLAGFKVLAAGRGTTTVNLSWTCPDTSGTLPDVAVTVTATEEQSGGNAPNQGDSGDPVGTFAGELFRTFPPDLDLGGPMPLRFQRYYASKLESDGNTTSALGANWLHNFDWRLFATATTARVVTSRGRVIPFDKVGSPWNLTGRQDVPFQLTEQGAELVLLDPRDSLLRVFDAAGKLVRIEDGRGNVHTLAYDARGRLVEQTDPTMPWRGLPESRCTAGVQGDGE